MRIGVLALTVFIAATGCAQAQSCNQSFNVDPNKSVTVLDFGGGAPLTMSMSCVDAELLREQMFVSGNAVDPDLFDEVSAIGDKMDQLDADLAAQKAILASAAGAAKKDAAVRATVAVASVLGAISSAAACAEGGFGACANVLRNVAQVFVAAQTASNDAAELTKKAKAAVALIQELNMQKNDLQGRLNQAEASLYKLKYNSMYEALCQSVQAQCLQ